MKNRIFLMLFASCCISIIPTLHACSKSEWPPKEKPQPKPGRDREPDDNWTQRQREKNRKRNAPNNYVSTDNDLGFSPRPAGTSYHHPAVALRCDNNAQPEQSDKQGPQEPRREQEDFNRRQQEFESRQDKIVKVSNTGRKPGLQRAPNVVRPTDSHRRPEAQPSANTPNFFSRAVGNGFEAAITACIAAGFTAAGSWIADAAVRKIQETTAKATTKVAAQAATAALTAAAERTTQTVLSPEFATRIMYATMKIATGGTAS